VTWCRRQRLAIAVAYAGSDVNPTWWLNLRDSPEAVARLRNRTITVRAALAEPGERAQLTPTTAP
jgi:F420H(2)-dependent quinone reductase